MSGLFGKKEEAPASAAAAAPSLLRSEDVNKDDMTFGEAFATARAEGAKDFMWNGLSYATSAAPGAKVSKRPGTAATAQPAPAGPAPASPRMAQPEYPPDMNPMAHEQFARKLLATNRG